MFIDIGQVKTRYTDNPAQRSSFRNIPMIQAFLYMFVVMFMPIVLVLGRYRFRVFLRSQFCYLRLCFVILFGRCWVGLKMLLYESFENPVNPGTRFFKTLISALCLRRCIF